MCDKKSNDPDDELMETTKLLLQILAMGQLLPPPLSDIHMVIENFDPPEIAIILKDCVWNYLKDHVPSPALFPVDSNGLHWRNFSSYKVPDQYVEVLRVLMLKNIEKFGQQFYEMFVMSELNKPTKVIEDDVVNEVVDIKTKIP